MNEKVAAQRLTLEGAQPLRTDVCPHPGKKLYRSKSHAKKYLKSASISQRSLLAPYMCECGSWHIGHKRGNRKNRTSQPRA